MRGFDIQSLLEFKPPKYHCEKCLALMESLWDPSDLPACRVCKVMYMPTDEYAIWDSNDYLKTAGYSIEFDNVINHSKSLAWIGKAMEQKKPGPLPPLRALLMAMSRAQSFIHFASFGISHMIIGALKLAAQRVRVRGIVSGADAKALSGLTGYTQKAPNLEVKAYGLESRSGSTPHQKLIVIDGLLAFKGSANSTLSGWRKAAEGRDFVEVVTKVEEVIKLHNTLFSPIWAEHSDVGDEIVMEPVP